MTSHFCGCSGSFGCVSENGAQPKNCNLAVTCTIKPWLSSGVGLYPSNLTHTQLLGIGWWEDLQDQKPPKIKFSTPASFLQQITTPLSLTIVFSARYVIVPIQRCRQASSTPSTSRLRALQAPCWYWRSKRCLGEGGKGCMMDMN